MFFIKNYWFGIVMQNKSVFKCVFPQFTKHLIIWVLNVSIWSTSSWWPSSFEYILYANLYRMYSNIYIYCFIGTNHLFIHHFPISSLYLNDWLNMEMSKWYQLRTINHPFDTVLNAFTYPFEYGVSSQPFIYPLMYIIPLSNTEFHDVHSH